VSDENLTPENLKYICEVFFKSDPLRLLTKLILRLQVARKENNIILANLLQKDINTIKISTHFSKIEKENKICKNCIWFSNIINLTDLKDVKPSCLFGLTKENYMRTKFPVEKKETDSCENFRKE
jgi:hypothetical protein